MRKNDILLFAAIVALVMTGCKKEKEEVVPGGVPRTFTAYFAQPSNSKVHLESVNDGANMRPGWDGNDQININGAPCTIDADDIDEGNPSRAEFTASIGYNPNGAYYSVYPNYGTTCGCPYAGGKIQYPDGYTNTTVPTVTVTLPRVQYYRDPDGVQFVDAPMVAYNPENPHLYFKNLCGIMQVVITNDKAWDMVLDSIHVVSSGYDLWGSGFAVSTPNATPSISTPEASGKNTISLARANSGSIGTTVLSTHIHGATTPACTLYVYLPPISSSSNKFTVRVFSHPKWGDTPDDEVHIVYTKTQADSKSSGAISASQIRKFEISLEGCGNFGTTITSMKAFTAGTGNKICFSRGHVQYDCATGRKRFAPRQWSFLENTRDGVMNYNGWIEHFCWATGNNFSRHGLLSGDYNNNTNDLSGNADWGTHFNNYYLGTNTPTNSIWRTPSQGEYKQIFFAEGPTTSDLLDGTLSGITNTTRHQDTCSRYIWVTLSGVPGLSSSNLRGIVAFPDHVDGSNFHMETGAQYLTLEQIHYTNDNGRKMYNNNSLNISQLEYLEAKGCIFFPCLGTFTDEDHYNDGWDDAISVGRPSDGPEGAYWTSGYHYAGIGYQSYAFKAKTGYYYTGSYVYPYSDVICNYRECVRLCCPYNTAYKYDPDQM